MVGYINLQKNIKLNKLKKISNFIRTRKEVTYFDGGRLGTKSSWYKK